MNNKYNPIAMTAAAATIANTYGDSAGSIAALVVETYVKSLADQQIEQAKSGRLPTMEDFGFNSTDLVLATAKVMANDVVLLEKQVKALKDMVHTTGMSYELIDKVLKEIK